MLDFNVILESKLLLLRPMRLKDADAMLALTSDAAMWTYFTADLSIPSELKAWIENAIEDKNRMAFSVVLKDYNQIIGSTSIGNISMHDRRAEIGWTWLAKSQHGKGVNAQVKYLLLKYLFEECSFERIEFKTDVLNHAARKALLKIGAIEEGVLRSHTQMIRNRRRDTIYYSILKSEWKDMKQPITGYKAT